MQLGHDGLSVDHGPRQDLEGQGIGAASSGDTPTAVVQPGVPVTTFDDPIGLEWTMDDEVTDSPFPDGPPSVTALTVGGGPAYTGAPSTPAGAVNHGADTQLDDAERTSRRPSTVAPSLTIGRQPASPPALTIGESSSSWEHSGSAAVKLTAEGANVAAARSVQATRAVRRRLNVKTSPRAAECYSASSFDGSGGAPGEGNGTQLITRNTAASERKKIRRRL